jgi:NTP pyrophosphatase (non-canonical NTP hydrolase)
MKDLLLTDRAIRDLVQFESQHQVMKWGIQDRSPFEWMTYIAEEIGEMAQAIQDHEYHDGRADHVAKEAIQAATLCLKMAEMFLNIEGRSGSGGV